MSGELAVGVVTKLAAGGITRVLGVLYAPIKRRQTIDRKTKDADGEATRKFTDAINDLRVLLGNKYGQYTTSVDALFDELTRVVAIENADIFCPLV